MASEQGQDGWNDATNTFRSEDCSIKGWEDEDSPQVEETIDDDSENIERLARQYLEDRKKERGAEDPFDYTPWIATLPMPLVKEIEQGCALTDSSLESKFKPM